VSELSALDVPVTPVDKFREFLRTKGLRLTPEREAVVRAVYASHEHFDADHWVSTLVLRPGKKEASRSTVYRTLDLMAESGLIRKVARVNDRAVYEHDYGYPQHDHLICKKCHKLIEFPNEEIASVVEKVAAEHGFRMTGHRLEVEGICADCSRPPKRSHRKLEMI
jgi:Fur family ferric uptake transcriptional regulator